MPISKVGSASPPDARRHPLAVRHREFELAVVPVGDIVPDGDRQRLPDVAGTGDRFECVDDVDNADHRAGVYVAVRDAGVQDPIEQRARRGAVAPDRVGRLPVVLPGSSSALNA